MTVLAIVEPSNLVARELRETLERSRQEWSELRLLSTGDAVGTLTDVRGAAAMVLRAETERFAGVDLAFFCGPVAEARRLLAEQPDLAAVLLCPDAAAGDGAPLVAGVNLQGMPARIALSPQPAVVLLAHLLQPLLSLGLREAVATVLQPISAREQEGLDEVLEQTKALLAFSAPPEPVVFGRQMAFNMMPAADPMADPAPQLRTVLGTDAPIAVRRLQGGMFHAVAVSLYVRVLGEHDATTVREALARSPVLELADEPGTLGPIDAAGRDEVLVGEIEPDPHRPGGFWLWATMDNLTRGGAVNALAIARQRLAGG